ncbi:hypothetical protein I307_03592 [Cryptococcus deuterogattii 99/473]|uniref:Uncharacterized protein n=1 Tax=Cryptococcus deuterogattii Ram5 TaxID=1296110 RepID=A0A0D0TB99_9TREE|nr:hypothetical protein I309_00619 [Cryptococcus deuterogattii LA55]KIR36856.1 hypothetical protein I352_00168 [Cryptococcus deuterogattii MMRL2647]KIR43327.1 hypothetical protein I313_00169 [Cryptococcus deuterogattii Ram5]KIR74660.1 hypothetical protein I310_00934 [Cryptococcus deuterogattii CA1014]KIR92413.1 hypothetical protein I304_03817 [Cryptococcus deuterogattii CBS 10090]KIS01579.1 hypothetical protein L804_01457 [Cryptococcus deuterogattii 2001/935-1]KIY56855.1 hypothetical protein 
MIMTITILNRLTRLRPRYHPFKVTVRCLQVPVAKSFHSSW